MMARLSRETFEVMKACEDGNVVVTHVRLGPQRGRLWLMIVVFNQEQ